MRARALVDGERVLLDSQKALGDGGEASVFLVSRGKERLAVKRYHTPTPARAAKLEALLALRGRLPTSVVAPSSLVFDEDGRAVIGFAMPLLPDGCEPLSQLSRKSFRDARSIRRGDVCRILVGLGAELAQLHDAGVVVGDLNDQNEVFGLDLRVRFIDADSFQLPGFACEVATEAFLDPLLYGPDPCAPCLTEGGRPRRFTVESDWYAFAVLAFRALTGVHPFGGALDELPALPLRAARGVSVLDARVQLPPSAREGVGLLTRPLEDAFAALFERRARAVFPLDRLVACAEELVRCTCGLELPATRLPCPRCHPRSASVARTPRDERVFAEELLVAQGPLVALAARGATILAVALEEEIPVLYTIARSGTSRAPLAERRARDGFHVALSADRVGLVPRGASEGSWICLASGARVPFVTERTSGCASFAVAPEGFYRIARGTLLVSRLDGDAIVESPVTAVVSEQTRLVTTGSRVMASERSFAGRRAMAIAAGRRVDLALDPLAPGESLVEETLLSCSTSLAVLRVTSAGGRRVVRTAIFDARGVAKAATMRLADERLADEAIAGGLLSGDAHLVATDRGLVREELSPGGAEVLFAGAARHVGRDALLASSDAGLVAAHERHVTLLRLDRRGST